MTSPNVHPRKHALYTFLRVAVSVTLIVFLLTLVDVYELTKKLSRANPWILLLAFFLLFLQLAISTVKWHQILQHDGRIVRMPLLLRTYLIGNFLSLFLPTSFGGDIYRVAKIREAAGSMSNSAASVLLDRLSGLLALVTVALIAYQFADFAKAPLLLLAIYVTGVLAIALFTSRRVALSGVWQKTSILKPIGAVLQIFVEYRRKPRLLLIVAVLSLIFQFMIVVMNKLYTLALGIDIQFSVLLVIIPLIYLTELLPISINGIGVRDSAFVFFFTALGYSAEDALAVSVLLISMRYAIGLVGGATLALSK